MDEYDYAIMDRKRVRDNYLQSWFIPDILSSVPIEIIELMATTGKDGGYLRASKILKLLRLSRIAKIIRIMKLSKLTKLFQDLQVQEITFFACNSWIFFGRGFREDFHTPPRGPPPLSPHA